MSHHPERTARNVRPVNQPPSLSNDYVVEGSCKIYRRDSFGKNHLIGVVSAAKKFKTPSVSFQQNVGPILGNKRRQEDRL